MTSQIKFYRLIAVVVACVMVLYVSTVQPAGVDFWLQAKIGEQILDSGIIPRTLQYPFTEVAEQVFNAHEWLVSIGFHLLVTWVGEAGLTYVLSVLGVLYFSLVVWFCYERSGRSFAAGLAGGLIAIATENYRHVLRPELITLLIFVPYWVVLERAKHNFSLWHMPIAFLISVIWTNSHGSFILAPAMAGIYTAGTYIDLVIKNKRLVLPNRQVLIYMVFGLLATIACLVNPFGLEMLKFVFGFSNAADLPHKITEWIPTLDPRFRRELSLRVAASVWLLTISLMLVKRKFFTVTDWLIFIFFTLLSLKAIRFPVYFGLVSAYLVVPLIGKTINSSKREGAVFLIISVVSSLAILLAVNFGNLQGARSYAYSLHKLSDQMVSALRDERRHGNVLNSMEMGAELIYWAYPRLKPSSDCRVDSYGFDYLDYLDAVLHNDALLKEFVARYDVKYILMDRRRFNNFIYRDGWKERRWEVVLVDDRAAFLRRADVPY